MLNTDWAKVEDEIRVNAERLYWRARLERGTFVPTRQLVNIAREVIDEFNSAGVDEFPRTDVHNFIDSAEKWLDRQRGKLWKLMEQEEANR